MNKYLYHYTGLDTLLAILHWYKTNRSTNCIQLKASCIYNMNDPKEMDKGYDLIKKVLIKYETQNQVPLHLRLSEVYSDKNADKECKDSYIIKDQYVDCFTDVPYITCFSRRKDYLPMWSLYGNGGKGVCLIFESSKILDYFMAHDIHGKIGDVVYNSKPGKDFLTILDYCYDCYLKEQRESATVSIDEKIKQLSFICEFLSPFAKYKDYSYEKETRIIYDIRNGKIAFDAANEQVSRFLEDLNKIKGTTTQSLLQMSNFLSKYNQKKIMEPYTFQLFGVECLHSIMLGPSVNYDVIKPIIDRELYDLDLHIETCKSKIPYR